MDGRWGGHTLEWRELGTEGQAWVLGYCRVRQENGVWFPRLLSGGGEDSAGGLQTCCWSTQRKEEEKGWESKLRPGVKTCPRKQGRWGEELVRRGEPGKSTTLPISPVRWRLEHAHNWPRKWGSGVKRDVRAGERVGGPEQPQDARSTPWIASPSPWPTGLSTPPWLPNNCLELIRVAPGWNCAHWALWGHCLPLGPAHPCQLSIRPSVIPRGFAAGHSSMALAEGRARVCLAERRVIPLQGGQPGLNPLQVIWAHFDFHSQEVDVGLITAFLGKGQRKAKNKVKRQTTKWEKMYLIWQKTNFLNI